MASLLIGREDGMQFLTNQRISKRITILSFYEALPVSLNREEKMTMTNI